MGLLTFLSVTPCLPELGRIRKLRPTVHKGKGYPCALDFGRSGPERGSSRNPSLHLLQSRSLPSLVSNDTGTKLIFADVTSSISDFGCVAEPKAFYYRRKYDSALGELTPYSPHSIVLGSHVYPTAAHLYWSIAFAKHPHIVKAIRDLRAVSDNDESVGKLLYIARQCKGLVRTEFEFIDKRKGEYSGEHFTVYFTAFHRCLPIVLEIMLGVLLLKLCQHESVQKVLLDTGDLPLMYTQIPMPGQAKNDKLLDAVAGKIFGEKDAKGQRLNWGSLLHPDDAFWGVEPILDPKGEGSNHL